VGSPAARLGDPTAHGGSIVVGQPTVLIGGQPAARIGDMHLCPRVTVLVPHVGGPLVFGSFTVLTGSVPQSRVGDMLVCVGPPDSVATGCPTVLVGMAGGGLGFGAIIMGLAAGLRNFPGDTYPRSSITRDGKVVTQYNAQITMEGSPSYQATVVADLDRFLATRTGQLWADVYAATGRNLAIRPMPASGQQDNGGTTRVSPNDALVTVNPDKTETPGAGSDSIITYNPSYTHQYTGEDGNTYTQQPNEVLGHEMIHSLHNALGENRRSIPDTYPNGDNQEEARTIGVHGFDDEDISERQMSEDARGPGSARPDHDSVTGGTYQDASGVWHDSTYDSSGNVISDKTGTPSPGVPPNR
jgi:uncharacterized Zn-binding protein involved in type VI secretion